MFNTDRRGRVALAGDGDSYGTVMESLECVAVQAVPDEDLSQRAAEIKETPSPPLSHTSILFVGDEFKTVMDVLEHVSKRKKIRKDLRRKALHLWKRLLVEGGHVTVRELAEITKKYGK